MQPPTMEETRDPIWARLEDQIVVREQERSGAGHLQAPQDRADHRRVIIRFLADFQEQLRAALGEELDLLPALLIAALGVIVVVLEGNQYHKTWLDYRSTAEALKHEEFLFLAGAGPYVDVDDRRARLAERSRS